MPVGARIDVLTLCSRALRSSRIDVTRRATHYHTVAVDPIWNDSLIRTRHIGTHIFYRFPNWRERRAGVLQDRDA